MPNIHDLEHGSLCRYHDDEEFCDCGQLAWSTVDEQRARIAELEAALAKAEEALEEASCTSPKPARCIFSPSLGCPRCAALAAIRDAKKGGE